MTTFKTAYEPHDRVQAINELPSRAKQSFHEGLRLD